MIDAEFEDRLAGTLIGTALGDALGLPAEGLSPTVIARRFGRIDRFCLIGRTGFVSDDTEQSALVAQSLVRSPNDAAAFERAFGRALVGWLLRMPWGIGFATLRAALRRMIGFNPSGVVSAGNGAAMRSAITGVFFRDAPELRAQFGRRLAQVTHRDARAVEGALFVAELAARLSRGIGTASIPWIDALSVVTDASLGAALRRAGDLARDGTPMDDIARALGTTGFVIHTVPFALAIFLRHGERPLEAIQQAIAAGGDTDSIGAIVGAWCGARWGMTALPADLVAKLHDGPFGPTHLRALAHALAATHAGETPACPRYSPAAAMARNLALMPVILIHAVRHLIPW